MSTGSPAAPLARRGRLTRAAEFDAVTQLGRAVGGRYLTLRYRDRGDDGAPRFGFAVPRQVGGAVDRNAVKRRLRVAADAHASLARRGHDYVVIARPGLTGPLEQRSGAWLAEQLADLLAKAGPS